MGNKKSRALTRPRDRGRPCVCDKFQLTVTYVHPVLTLTLLTDLPKKTRVLVLAERQFREINGDEWSWTALEKNIPITEMEPGVNGFLLELTNEELDTKGLNMYRRLKRDMNIEIADRPNQILRIMIEAPKSDHRFGICNRKLTGSAVTVRNEGHIAETSCSIEVPISDAVLSVIGF